MKNKIMILAFLLIGISTTFTSCTKDEVEPVATTGGLLIKVQLANSTGYLTDVSVGLSTSQENLDNSVYIQDELTDNEGNVDFGQLNPGNYYYDCSTTIGGIDYYGEGQVQVTAGKNLELTLMLE